MIFTYVWSPIISDLWQEFDGFQVSSSYFGGPEAELYRGFMEEVVQQAQWKNNDLPAAIKSGHEIMIRCESYYAVRLTNSPEGEAAIKLINNAI